MIAAQNGFSPTESSVGDVVRASYGFLAKLWMKTEDGLDGLEAALTGEFTASNTRSKSQVAAKNKHVIEREPQRTETVMFKLGDEEMPVLVPR